MGKRLFVFTLLIVGALFYARFNQPQLPAQHESSFIKVSAQGEPMDIWSGPWSCVYDKNSGLLWEIKTDAEDIHHTSWTFSWFNEGIGVDNSGDCYFEAARCDAEDLLRRVNQKKLCGVDGWRLPTADELVSLVSVTAPPGDALIDSDFFPYTQRGDYWTKDRDKALASVYEHLGNGALAVSFVDGTITALPYRNAAFVMLVNDSATLLQKNSATNH